MKESIEHSITQLSETQPFEAKTSASIFTQIWKFGENWGGCFGLKWLCLNFFLTDYKNSYKNWFLDTLVRYFLLKGLAFYSTCFSSANFIQTAVKCKQKAEKQTNLFDFCNSFGCDVVIYFPLALTRSVANCKVIKP